MAKTPDRFTVPVGTIIGATLGQDPRQLAGGDRHRAAASPATSSGVTTPRGWTTVVTESKPTTATSTLRYAHDYTFELRARDYAPNVSVPVTTPSLRVSLHQSGSSLATYDSHWSSVAQSQRLDSGMSTPPPRPGPTMSFTFSGRSVAIVAPKGPSRGQREGLRRWRAQDDGRACTRRRRVAQGVVFSLGWSTSQRHTVKVVVVGTAGHPRVDLDAFVVVR